MIRLKINTVSKRFGRQLLFKNISLEMETGEVLLLKGKNGSGKSSFIKCLAGIYAFDKGSFFFEEDQKEINRDEIKTKLSIIAPYIFYFNDLTAEKNLKTLSGMEDEELIKNLFKKYQLNSKENLELKHYSSGMLQRFRLLISEARKSKILLLDEVSSNLDKEGKNLVKNYIESNKKESLIILASNEETEYSWGDKIIELG